MRIGELAERLGLNPKTLRYWEEMGLLPAVPRNIAGYRDYSEEHLQICEFIPRGQEAWASPSRRLRRYSPLDFLERHPAGV
ncbi:MAG: MerR family DNA-binding transcriptional regulator [Aquificota bacterium]|nr:MerR family DNA-binding transcriptional regulator [Aquificota bacterium]